MRSLPAQLLRYEVVTSRDPVADATLVGIVDDVYLPLLAAHG
ncbi:hypothetical protein OG824_20810 [Streptomyces prunicolor]|nr:hypothetical protein [Streptomyces prunicolor]MCX5237646.1 hypothetical protein [Streptomyces prunicolor]